MAQCRSPQQIARRAVILGALAFRASLEVTDHPRTAAISQQLLPWLEQSGCAGNLDPIEREELATPLGDLSQSQLADVNWAGESATFFCWVLGRLPAVEDKRPAEQSFLFDILPILKQGASTFLESAAVRDPAEIEEACRRFVLIQSLLREARVPAAREIIRRGQLQLLSNVGITADDASVNRAEDTVFAMTAEERARAAGLYIVRAHAGLWLFSDRPTYFEQ